MSNVNRNACTIHIVGVGGQGALTVSRIIGTAAIVKDVNILVSEVHGMAQRGGVVQTTIRLGETISPLPFHQDITVLVGFEPLEVYRSRVNITRETIIVMSTDPVKPTSVSSGGKEYPDVEKIVSALGEVVDCVFSLSAKEKARMAGNERTTNVVMLGALTGTGALPFTYDEMREAVERSVPGLSVEANLKAFELGYKETHGKNR